MVTPLAELLPLESSEKRLQVAQMTPPHGAAGIGSGLCALGAATQALWDALRIKDMDSGICLPVLWGLWRKMDLRNPGATGA